MCGWLSWWEPHHGAAANFHPEIVERWTTARLFVTADADAELRPHEDLLAELRHVRDDDVVRVTEDAEAEILQVTGAPEYKDTPVIRDRGYKTWT